jgi:hypothetical protein
VCARTRARWRAQQRRRHASGACRPLTAHRNKLCGCSLRPLHASQRKCCAALSPHHSRSHHHHAAQLLRVPARHAPRSCFPLPLTLTAAPRHHTLRKPCCAVTKTVCWRASQLPQSAHMHTRTHAHTRAHTHTHTHTRTHTSPSLVAFARRELGGSGRWGCKRCKRCVSKQGRYDACPTTMLG